jgi:hypothetical protein
MFALIRKIAVLAVVAKLGKWWRSSSRPQRQAATVSRVKVKARS